MSAVRALRLPGQRIERSRVATPPRGTGKNGRKKTQRVARASRGDLNRSQRKRGGAARGRCKRHECFKPTSCKPRAKHAARRTQCAIARPSRDGQHSFESLADCRKDHSWKFRFSPGAGTLSRDFFSDFCRGVAGHDRPDTTRPQRPSTSSRRRFYLPPNRRLCKNIRKVTRPIVRCGVRFIENDDRHPPIERQEFRAFRLLESRGPFDLRCLTLPSVSGLR